MNPLAIYGNLAACFALFDTDIIDEVTTDKIFCLSYNGSVIDFAKKFIEDSKEVKSFAPRLGRNLKDSILELEAFLKNQTQQTKEWQSKKMELEQNFLGICAQVGDSLRDTDINESIQYHEKACDLGHKYSCDEYIKLRSHLAMITHKK